MDAALLGEAIKLILTIGVPTAVLTYILNRKLEEFKVDLRDHDVRYSTMHKYRADAIDNLYKKIDSAQRTWEWGIGITPAAWSPEDKKKTYATLTDLVNYYWQNRLYFDAELSKDIEDFISKVQLAGIHVEFAGDFHFDPKPDGDPNPGKGLIGLGRAAKIISTDLPNLRKRIEDQMRDVLELHTK